MPVKKVTKKKTIKPVKSKVEATIVVEKPSKSKSLKIDVFDTKGKVVETISLPQEIFGATINKALLSQAVRIYLANQRQGSASTKTRGEVRGSTRKIYRQKGTGRARHGAIRAPIFVHGGIALGPKPRDFPLHFSKNMKKAALRSALSAKFKDGGIKVVSGIEKIEPKTKLMVKVLSQLGFEENKKLLLVIPSVDGENSKVTRAMRNIKGLSLTNSSLLHTYELLNHQMIVLMRNSIDILSKRFEKKQ